MLRRLLALGLLLGCACRCASAPPPPPPPPPPPSGLDELAAGQKAEQAGDLAAAKAHLQEAVKREPALGLAQVELADVLIQLGEEGPALDQALTAAQTLEPQNPRLWRLVGIWEEGRGHADAAIAAYEKTLALRPDDVKSRFRLAGLYSANGRVPDAVAAYRAVIAADPAERGARLTLAKLLEDQGDLAGAETELTALTQLDPANALYRQRLQALLVREGKAKPDALPVKKMRPLKPSRR